MGAVYRAYHLYLRKHVAVKVLEPGLEQQASRFEREAVAGAHVTHPNVAAATDFGKLEDGSFFLVVEYVRGETLADVIKRGPLPPDRAVRIARQLAAGLGAVHAIGVVHRDVKPRNVMLVEGTDDTVKLIDFGLARVSLRHAARAPQRSRLDSVPQRITGAGEVFGTLAYLAPEASIGVDGVDHRADLYALGVILFEMLAGRRPFTAGDVCELFRVQEGAPPSIAERAPGAAVPPALEAVVTRLLARDPAARYQSAAEVCAALDALERSRPSFAGDPTSSASRAGPRAAARWRPAALLAAMGLVSVAALAMLGVEMSLRPPSAAPEASPVDAVAAPPAASSAPSIAPQPIVDAGPGDAGPRPVPAWARPRSNHRRDAGPALPTLGSTTPRRTP
jgi:serine/threonine-protein kinase